MGYRLGRYVFAALFVFATVSVHAQTPTLTPTSLSFGNQVVSTTSAVEIGGYATFPNHLFGRLRT